MSNVSVWGWQQYFAELAQFLGHANRNLGVANKYFSSNVLNTFEEKSSKLMHLKKSLRRLHQDSC